MSMLERWPFRDAGAPQPYSGDDKAYRAACNFLDGVGVLEDWGCGTCYAKRFVHRARYAGIDGTTSKFNDITVDLVGYRSKAEYILIRGVLEHNFEWERLLRNAVDSFRKRMCLVVCTPLSSDVTKQIAWNPAIEVPDLSFIKSDLTRHFNCEYTEEQLETATQYGSEHLFYLSRS